MGAHFFLKQWHEKATEAQIEIVLKIVVSYLGLTELPTTNSKSKFPPPLKIRGLRGRVEKNN